MPQRCSIVDIWRGEDSKIKITTEDFRDHAEAPSTTTRILEAIHHPPQRVCLRVLLWWLHGEILEGNAGSDLLDICFFGLKLSPRFFEAIVDRMSTSGLNLSRRRKMVQPFLPTKPFQPLYTVVGSQISTIARNYLTHQADTPPVQVIVGWDDDNWDDDAFRAADVDDEASERMVLLGAAANDNVSVSQRSFSTRIQTYRRILDQLLEQSYGTETAEKGFSTLSIFSMMHLDTLHIQAKTRFLRKAIMFDKGRYREPNIVNLQDGRFSLRRHIEDSESARKNVARFANSEGGGDLLARQEYLRIEEL